MNAVRHKGKCCDLWNVTRPAVIGLLLSCAVTAAIIAAFSLVFVIIRSIAESAVIPLALISAALGCFAGAFLCAAMAGRRGVIFGAAVGFMMFLVIWVIGAVCSDGIFGTETAVKLMMLLLAGGAGGYLGSGCKGKRRK